MTVFVFVIHLVARHRDGNHDSKSEEPAGDNSTFFFFDLHHPCILRYFDG
jgi:hypothetical protein